MGASLTHTEMVSAIGLSYKNGKTKRLIGSPDEQGPTVLQLFAPDAASSARGAELALAMRSFDAVQINMACPMPKVTKRGAGAALLSRPDEARDIVASLEKFALPVWVKLRVTDRHSPLNTESLCESLIAAGAKLLAIHGRTPAQRYEGVSDKERVCSIARIFPGVVAASGDYYEPSDAITYLDGGCAAVLAARGVLRDMFLIPRTLAALGCGVPREFISPSLRERADAMIRFGSLYMKDEGERFGIVMVKRMLAGVFKGFPGASVIRQGCLERRDWHGMEEFLKGDLA
ncbi:tRNA-dihydrouridine synthase [Synergistales bacterium]|nr:tRNA-dihydrouridine synthase [Synergistales bacterium]